MATVQAAAAAQQQAEFNARHDAAWVHMGTVAGDGPAAAVRRRTTSLAPLRGRPTLAEATLAGMHN